MTMDMIYINLLYFDIFVNWWEVSGLVCCIEMLKIILYINNAYSLELKLVYKWLNPTVSLRKQNSFSVGC